ncbi:hypothetical protein JHD50_09060 [Sulfurimonas sp. MAG313]|nr:hypothetical protein [Sulfurimonas sp. MAG313]MDF1881446.1 hypothetical protein [Sulfurimonas sp. MAG313]
MKIILASLSCIFLLIGCGSNYTSDTKRGASEKTTVEPTIINTDVLINESLSFSDVHKLLNEKCLFCHGPNERFSLGDSSSPLSEPQAYNNVLLFINDLTKPEESALLQKSIGEMNHAGSSVFTKTSYEYKLISAWIDAGASFDESFDLNISITVSNAGYDLPKSPALSFTKYHFNATLPVQGQSCLVCHNKEGEGDLIRFGGTLSSYINTADKKYYQDLKNYTVNVVGNMGSDFKAKVYPFTSTVGHNNFYQSLDRDFFIGELFTVYIKDMNGKIINQSATNSHTSEIHKDCNRCHTRDGLNNAPGRVLVPLVY